MSRRERIEQLRTQLQVLKAVAGEEGCSMLSYLILVAEQEADDVLSGRFTPGSESEEFVSSIRQQ